VKFLIDQNRSPRLAQLLCDAGHDAVHTLEMGLEAAEDDELLAVADEQGRVVITGDTDFGALLALTRRRSPSVILFRARSMPRALNQAAIVLANLNDLGDDLRQGAVVVVTDDRIRVRRLPLLHDD
jgi:predicted nuclease of predicted toxin-antitoxin system